MKLISVLLCAFAIQVKSETTDIFPAKILAQQKTISEHSDFYVTCSTFGVKRRTSVYVYLCKDGRGIKMMVQKHDQNDTTFTISRARPYHSGNYSCVYSFLNDSPSKVTQRGYNIIQILVIDLSIPGPSTVKEGDHVEFRCTVSHTLKTLDGCKLIQAHLKRNESIIQGQVFDVTRMEVTFTIEGAAERDSGHYSCVVQPSSCIQEHERTLSGNNAVLLEVKVSLIIQVLVSCWMITMILSLGLALALWWMSNLRGDSFSEEQDENQSGLGDDDSTVYDDNEEDVYSVPNEK